MKEYDIRISFFFINDAIVIIYIIQLYTLCNKLYKLIRKVFVNILYSMCILAFIIIKKVVYSNFFLL